MKGFTLAAGLAFAASCGTPALAQIGISIGGPSGGSITIGGGGGFPVGVGVTVGRPPVHSGPVVSSGGSTFIPGSSPWHRPSYPVASTPHVVTGYNPWTGAVNTHNHQVNNTAFDPWRNASMNNGTRRWVNRPVTDPHGNVVGYERGWEWNNTVTGQVHGNTTVSQLNGTGGVSSTGVAYGVSSTSVQKFAD